MEVPQWETNQGNIQKLKSGVLILILMEVPQWATKKLGASNNIFTS